MTATDITFYATVATVIPVLLVAYVIAVRDTMGAFGEAYSAASRRYAQRMREAIEKEDGRAKNLFDAVGAILETSTYEIATFVLFVVAVGLPAAAEYASLHGLYAGHASGSSKTICLIGALVAGAIVVAPLVARVFRVYRPFPFTIGLMASSSLSCGRQAPPPTAIPQSIRQASTTTERMLREAGTRPQPFEGGKCLASHRGESRRWIPAPWPPSVESSGTRRASPATGSPSPLGL